MQRSIRRALLSAFAALALTGVALAERALVPSGEARLCETRFEDWLAASTGTPLEETQ